MSTRYPRRLSSVALLAAVVTLVAGAGSLAGEQVEAPPEQPRMDQPDTMGQGMMSEEMMQMHQKMHAEMKAMDQRLDLLVADMQAASGDDKVDAMAAVVAELVDQRKARHAMMMEMQPKMMHRMMQRMGSGMMHGMMHGMMQSMDECPMMEGMMRSMGDCPMMQQAPSTEGSPEEPDDDHAEHHPEG